MSFHSGAAIAARALLVVAVATVLQACGSSGGTSAHLPAGPPTSAPDGDLVVYVAMAQGDRIDAYRLGSDGLLPSTPFDTVSVLNPRHLFVADGVLYASLFDRIVSFRIGANGSLPSTPTSSSLTREDYEPLEIEVRNGLLYVAAAGVGVVESYELEENGDLPVSPTGVGSGEFPAEYVSLEFSDNYLYSGTRQSQLIDIFILEQDGNVPPQAELQDPLDGISLPDDIFIRDEILYVTSASDRGVRAYHIHDDGFIGGEEDSRTKSEDFYSDIMIDGDTLYAAAYSSGRIDLYSVKANGMLPEEAPFFETADDPASYPARMLMHGGILYVAQAGLDRVDAYVLGINGLPPQYPSSSTTPAPGNSFPVDLVIHQLD